MSPPERPEGTHRILGGVSIRALEHGMQEFGNLINCQITADIINMQMRENNTLNPVERAIEGLQNRFS